MKLDEITSHRRRVVVVGGGFGGLTCARELSGHGLEIVLIDRHDYTLFQPMLYQVATAAVPQDVIAEPISAIVGDHDDIDFVVAEVEHVDLQGETLSTSVGPVRYDYLVLAAGAVPNFFGNEAIHKAAYPLKTLRDAVDLRTQVLNMFEAASVEADAAARQRMLTFVVVGGGPIGIEFAGALAELSHHVIGRDEYDLRTGDVKIILVEAGDHLMAPYPKPLRQYTTKRLEKLGVEVRLDTRVAGDDAGGVVLADGSHIPAATLVWGTGTRAAELANSLKDHQGRGGLIQVGSDFSLAGSPEVFAIGDIAAYTFMGEVLPGMAQPAIQGGRYVAQVITKVRERGEDIAPFSYWDKGSMAVIGRGAAISTSPLPQPYHADEHAGKKSRHLNLHGFPAWSAWLGLHLTYLSGFRNRAITALDWSWDYIAGDPGDKVIDALRRADKAEGPKITEPTTAPISTSTSTEEEP